MPCATWLQPDGCPDTCPQTHACARVSVVGIAAEVYVCRRIADDTGGSYGVALNEGHLEQLLLAHSTPPPATSVHARAELVGAWGWQ